MPAHKEAVSIQRKVHVKELTVVCAVKIERRASSFTLACAVD